MEEGQEEEEVEERKEEVAHPNSGGVEVGVDRMKLAEVGVEEEEVGHRKPVGVEEAAGVAVQERKSA